MKYLKSIVLLLHCAHYTTYSFIIKPKPNSNRYAYGYTVPSYENEKLKGSSDTSSLPASISSNFLSLFSNLKRSKEEEKDIIVIGGGIAGLSIALELTLKHNRKVCILEKSSVDKQGKNGSGSFAAAGMLAPQSERLPLGPLLDCCYASREMYSDFVDVVEELAAQCDNKEYFLCDDDDDNDNNDNDNRHKVGYRSKGGFIAPAFAGDSVSSWAPPEGYGKALWLDDIQVKSLEPELHPDVIGGWWFPQETSVDARRLTCSLGAACHVLGVDMCFGEDYAVDSLDLNDGQCTAVRTVNGHVYKGNKVIVANGSWMRDLLPVPIIPHKGQSMSLKPINNNAHAPPLLNRVLFAQDTYIVPKADGRIIIGATVEPGSFDTSVTSGGMMHVMTAATGLIPALRHYQIDEMWAGLRPTTPDKAPILGKTPWDNLIIAGGYWRNGILLAPKTSQLIADLATDTLSTHDQTLLDAFAWDRFLSSGEGASTKLALQSKYASSVHPLQYHSNTHESSTTNNIAGTELGFYSDATVAKQERKNERDSMFNDDTKQFDDIFEKAAMDGKKDGSAFVYHGYDGPTIDHSNSWNEARDRGHHAVLDKINQIEAARDTPGNDYDTHVQDHVSTSALDTNDKVPSLLTDSDSTNYDKSLQDLYQTIRNNKAEASKSYDTNSTHTSTIPTETPKKEFNFKIFHLHKDTGEKTLVPPGIKPDEFERILAAKNGQQLDNTNTSTEKTFDAAIHHDNPLVQQMNAAEKRGQQDASSTTDTFVQRMVAAEKNGQHDASSTTAPDEKTYDGYMTLQEGEFDMTTWRSSRQQNRKDYVNKGEVGAERE